MKRKLVAFIAATCCTFASAQSSVTIFGIMDTAVQRVTSQGGGSVSRMVSGASSATRLGFRGVEDLGDGLKAEFWLEASLMTDDGRGGATNANNQASGAGVAGGLTFGRRSTVGLIGRWGELRMGRDYNPGIWNTVLEDPFGNIGVGASQVFNTNIIGVTQLRVSNAVAYFTPPTLGGFFANVSYWLGENPSGAADSNDGNGGGVRIGYANGPAEFSVATSRIRYANGDVRNSNVGGSWNFGGAKAMGSLSSDRAGTTKGRGGQVGVIVPFGSGDLKASYSRYQVDTGIAEPAAAKIALGYVYSFSKRTAVYTTIARVRNSNGSLASVALGGPVPAAGRASSGIDVGIRHSF